MKNIGKQIMDKSVTLAVLIGLGCAVILSVIITGILAAIVSGEKISLGAALFMIPVIHFLSSFIGSVVAGKSVQENKAVTCGIVCVIFCLLQLCISALFMEGISGKFWVGVLASFVGSVGAVLISTRNKSAARRAKRRRMHG